MRREQIAGIGSHGADRVPPASGKRETRVLETRNGGEDTWGLLSSWGMFR